MPFLTVRLPERDRRISCTAGRSIREILDETDIRVRAGCDGGGACGLCRIRIVGGNAGEVSPTELLTLDNDQLRRGVRLACQVHAEHDLRIEIINPAPRSVWRRLEDDRCQAAGRGEPPAVAAEPGNALGAAIDLGTTHISITIHDLTTGRCLTGRRGLNPQADSGSDVLTRLQAASTEGRAEKLGNQVVRAIGDGLQDIATREGIDLRRVSQVVLAGNTAMLALLSGRNFELLLQPDYWSRAIDCQPFSTVAWLEAWQIAPHGAIEVLPPVAGFVGSDLLAGVVAARLTEDEPGALLIDFGTNSEVALWDGHTLWITSAAGGPAFEGCGLSCGMPADPGAVFRVRGVSEEGELSCEVIGDAEPLGLCGTGLIDLLACLIRNGTLNAKGQFARSTPPAGLVLTVDGRTMTITKKDVDTFQRAKAAIGVAVRVLLSKAGMDYSQLRRIAIGGIFGQYLDVVSAMEIGLLPSIPGIVETAGNTALTGCEAVLLSSSAKERLQEALARAVSINLAACDDFDMLFMEHLFLLPITGDANP